MFRIDDPSAAAALPTPEAAGTEGYWTEGNPGSGIAATLARASFLNMVQEELRNIVTAAGLTPSKTVYNQVLSAILKIAGGSSRVRGLVGANNSGTPNTQFDFSAAAVDFRDPTGGTTPSVSNVATITNNVLTAGPAANGRDQAGAFTASSWLHFYFIYNPTTGTVATISSASAPPTGPTLPAGYTAWSYIGAVFFSGASALANGFFRGSWFTYSTPVAVVSGGTQTLRTAVSLTTSIPPNALQLRPRIVSLQVTSNGSGTYSAQVTLEVVSALTAYLYGLAGTAGASLNMFAYGGTTVLPNVGQNVNYFITMTSGTAPVVTIAIDGYSNPNGGE